MERNNSLTIGGQIRHNRYAFSIYIDTRYEFCDPSRYRQGGASGLLGSELVVWNKEVSQVFSTAINVTPEMIFDSFPQKRLGEDKNVSLDYLRSKYPNSILRLDGFWLSEFEVIDSNQITFYTPSKEYIFEYKIDDGLYQWRPGKLKIPMSLISTENFHKVNKVLIPSMYVRSPMLMHAIDRGGDIEKPPSLAYDFRRIYVFGQVVAQAFILREYESIEVQPLRLLRSY